MKPSPRHGTLVLLAALSLFACRRSETTSPAPAPSTTSAPSAAPSASTGALTHEQAKATLVAWNDALDHHDAASLGPLYADTVDYYGKKLGGPAVVQMKANALKKDAEFHQQIVGDPTFVDGSDLRVDFLKRSGHGFKVRDVKASLLFGLRGNKVVILQETDEPTERRAAKEAANPGSSWQQDCERIADDVVNALPRVKKEIASLEKAVEKSKRDDVHLGGIGPDWGASGLSATIGIDQPERFENYIFYDVNNDAVLSVTCMGEDLTIPAAAQARVKKACTPPPPAQ